MASEVHLAQLMKGVDNWNSWRQSSQDVLPDLSDAILSGLNLRGANFFKANLRYANVGNTDLSDADFSQAELIRANFSDARIIGTKFVKANLLKANLFNAFLREVNLAEADLRKADLSRAYLYEDNLQGTNLSGLQALDTIFNKVELTGVCLEHWNINNGTKFEDVECAFVYLRQGEKERRPSSGYFTSGEFAALFQRILETVDLIFADGIDWKAFLESFRELRSRYGDENISIQTIEKRSGNAFVIRLEVPPEADKAEIESQAKDTYRMKLQILEERYRVELNAKEQEIEVYKHQNIKMEKIVELLAAKEEPKVSLHPNQIKVLQSISAGANNSRTISAASGLSIDVVRYYVRLLGEEGYLKLAEYNDGISAENDYICHLTSQGRIAIENPDLLIPLKSTIAPTMINNNDLRGASVANFANQLADNARQQVNQYNYAPEQRQTLAEAAAEIQKLLEQLSTTYSTDTVSGRMQLATEALHRIESNSIRWSVSSVL